MSISLDYENIGSKLFDYLEKNKIHNSLINVDDNYINRLQLEKIITQSEFLQKLGIVERANILSQKISFKGKADMFFRLKKLLDHKEMGNLFK